MSSSWRRNLGNVRSFVSNSMGGLRGGSNIASWVVAGTLAYLLWVKPSQDLKREQEEKDALAAADPNRYVVKRKPMPDPQQTGLIYGDQRKIDLDKKEGGKARGMTVMGIILCEYFLATWGPMDPVR